MHYASSGLDKPKTKNLLMGAYMTPDLRHCNVSFVARAGGIFHLHALLFLGRIWLWVFGQV
jgi:hypothetical protein